jgi:hypothetical protein
MGIVIIKRYWSIFYNDSLFDYSCQFELNMGQGFYLHQAHKNKKVNYMLI